MPTTKKELDAAAAQEAEAEQAADPYVSIPLAGYDGVIKDVRTLPATKWRVSALRALRDGDIDAFMSRVLHEDDYDTYLDLDPDQDGIGHFAQAAADSAGEDLGKSPGPRRSSKTTRKR
ncbi:hypothetical protein ADK70_12375 [Streptomyces rimosus subsp. pseudoverticillatus]|uniref:hypothetical protein n=1 Tax=Streptomyces rimosus TaxID=1927 RepID=UPI0006B26EED|nr:hypothetical protein [Streptomyces rimosus]KOT94471.1 hypothetical protein ADK70_12375 [Streptomyces rimosus subsp. pseudoverticillatus]